MRSDFDEFDDIEYDEFEDNYWEQRYARMPSRRPHGPATKHVRRESRDKAYRAACRRGDFDAFRAFDLDDDYSPYDRRH